MEALLADFGALELRLEGFSTIANGRDLIVSEENTEPEYWSNRSFARDVDVYSFGVVLLQLASGEPVILRSGKCRLPLAPGSKHCFSLHGHGLVNWVWTWNRCGTRASPVPRRAASGISSSSAFAACVSTGSSGLTSPRS